MSDFKTIKVREKVKRNLKAFAALRGLTLSKAIAVLLDSHKAGNKQDNQQD